MGEAYIIDAVRTPRGVGKPGKGALSHLHPQHLGATVLKALKERNNLKTEDVEDVIFSTSSQKGKQGGDIGRMSALLAGYDTKASGVTLDRFCGGGITSVNLAAAQIMSGMEDLVVAGGVEMMSYHQELAAQDHAAGIKPLGMGAGNMSLQAVHPQSHQGVCGDAIAAKEGISREAVDALALESQRRADRAIKEGRFAKSVVPVLNEDGSV
ncbi:MAG: beta-ketoacyl synthase N-terminal-like domain-containing protein, partial [Sphingomonadaceae bacterium]|nr:beta-ketoacyl synthase N-terminal-like domain-containing protein [Sphingomonadaceae bacterium]